MRDSTPMITIPSVSSRWEDALASVWPPMMQFRIKKPCIENTVKAPGIMDP